jgi:hypothetical protein
MLMNITDWRLLISLCITSSLGSNTSFRLKASHIQYDLVQKGVYFTEDTAREQVSVDIHFICVWFLQ